MNTHSSHPSEGSDPLLTVQGQYIKDLSFENPRGFESFLDTSGQPGVDVKINVGVIPLSEKNFEVVLDIRAEARTSEAPLYIIELSYAGAFLLGTVDEELQKKLLLLECPRLLFPFARCIIASVTQESGFPPFVLNPFDFQDLYDQNDETVKQNS